MAPPTVTITGAALPAVTVTANDSSAWEHRDYTGHVHDQPHGSTTAAVTVNFTMSGTATGGGVNYTLKDAHNNTVTNSVTLLAGEASETITLTPVIDTLIEGSEKAILTLAHGTCI